MNHHTADGCGRTIGFARSNDTYYNRHGHHRNLWLRFDAVVVQLQRAAHMMVDECDHEAAELLDTQQGIRQWRQRMMPSGTILECFSHGILYRRRVAVDDQRSDDVDSNCSLCAQTIAANQELMLADYLETLSPTAPKVEIKSDRRTEQRSPRKRRFHNMELWEPWRRQKVYRTVTS